jgi:hypothetical protein
MPRASQSAPEGPRAAPDHLHVRAHPTWGMTERILKSPRVHG